MPDGPPPTIERRPVPGTARSFSAITVRVDPSAVAPPSVDARTVALLRRARERGVTTFDVAEARFPARAERLIATAFPTPDPKVMVIVGRSAGSLAKERGSERSPTPSQDLTTALEESLEQSRRRLAPALLAVVVWNADAATSSTDSSSPPPQPRSPEGQAELLWATRLPSPATSLPETPRSSSLFSGELSLLDHEVVPLFGPASGRPEASLIARDPFSDGRLDGSRFAAVGILRGPGVGPVDVTRLRAKFDPVLALGFLTKGRRRTLAQAALHFVLGWPWVATTVIPLPNPERFEEVLGFGTSPPLNDEELAELGRLK